MGGCAADDTSAGDGDGDVDPYACEPSADAEGEPFAIDLGLRANDNSFIALPDGGDLPIVLGYQGFFMIELRVDSDSLVPPGDVSELCLECTVGLSAAGSFEGVTQHEYTQFTEMKTDVYSAFSTLLLGTYDELQGGDVIGGQEAELTMSCSGHGFSGSGQTTVHLTLAE